MGLFTYTTKAQGDIPGGDLNSPRPYFLFNPSMVIKSLQLANIVIPSFILVTFFNVVMFIDYLYTKLKATCNGRHIQLIVS